VSPWRKKAVQKEYSVFRMMHMTHYLVLLLLCGLAAKASSQECASRIPRCTTCYNARNDAGVAATLCRACDQGYRPTDDAMQCGKSFVSGGLKAHGRACQVSCQYPNKQPPFSVHLTRGHCRTAECTTGYYYRNASTIANSLTYPAGVTPTQTGKPATSLLQSTRLHQLLKNAAHSSASFITKTCRYCTKQ
jgi:hypothetical protein